VHIRGCPLYTDFPPDGIDRDGFDGAGVEGAGVDGVGLEGAGVEGAGVGLDEHPLNKAATPTTNAAIPKIAKNKFPLGSTLLTGLFPQYWNIFCVFNPLLSTNPSALIHLPTTAS
jgi:hypothetical protein